MTKASRVMLGKPSNKTCFEAQTKANKNQIKQLRQVLIWATLICPKQYNTK